MKTGKQIFVRQEIRERVTLRRRGRTIARGLCERCAGETAWLRVDEAVEITDLSAREIFRLVEQNAVHFVETGRGNLLVCAASLVENAPGNSPAALEKGVL